MDGVNEALKLIAVCVERLDKTDFTDTIDDLPGVANEVHDLLKRAIDKLASK